MGYKTAQTTAQFKAFETQWPNLLLRLILVAFYRILSNVTLFLL